MTGEVVQVLAARAAAASRPWTIASVLLGYRAYLAPRVQQLGYATALHLELAFETVKLLPFAMEPGAAQ